MRCALGWLRKNLGLSVSRFALRRARSRSQRTGHNRPGTDRSTRCKMKLKTPRYVALLIVFCSLALRGFAVEITEPAGAEHGYPGLCNTNGKKLADGEFRQWMQNDKLHVVITYKFPDGQFFEENALFRQEPELIQEKWSWTELKDGKTEREFAADFLAGTASAHIRKDNKDVNEKIDIVPG